MTTENIKTLLLVEDEVLIAMAKQQELTQYGYKVLTTNTGEKAVEISKENHDIDLILMDIDLGRGIDGTIAAEIILRTRKIPIVFLSSHIEPEVVEKTEKITSYGYVVKSSGITVLDASIKMAFKLFDAYKKVHTSEERLNEAQHLVQIGSWELDLLTDTLYWSDEVYRIFDLEPKKFCATYEAFLNNIHPDDRDFVNKSYTESVKNKLPYDIVHRLLLKDGTLKTVNERCKTYYNADGKAIRSIGTVQDITKRRKSEAAQREDVERFRQIYEHMSVGVAQVSLDFRIKAANDAYCQMLGYSEKELIGIHLKEITHPEVIEENLYKQAQLAAGELDHYRMEKQFIHKNGHVIEGVLDANLIRNKNSKPLYFLGSVYDITEQKLAKKHSAAQKQRLDNILHSSNIGTWEWTVQTGETIFNERWAEIIGYTLKEISPVSVDTWIKFTHPDDLKYSDELLKKHFTGELEYYECEARMLHKNGEWVWVQDRGKVSAWAKDGKPLLMAGTHMDITERKQADKELQNSQEQLEIITDHLSPLIAYVDADEKYLYVNQSYATWYGRGKDEIIGKHLKEVLYEESYKSVSNSIEKVLKGENITYENISYDLDGELKAVKATYTPHFDEEGKVKAFIATVIDISDQKQIEESLRNEDNSNLK